ncbi:MAG: chromate transporter [Thermoanaerobacteraceae bacterium]|nr:chromate transporter [Thermoanaerobacteraceae bacterium]
MDKKNNLKQLTEIFLIFLKIGAFTFGGGFAMIPLIEREVINNKGWVKEEEIIDVFAVSQSIPGAIAINSATFIGYKIAGRKGAFTATLGVVLPSFITITLIAAFFTRFQDNPVVKAAFMGIRPAVVGLILLAAVKVGKAAIKDKVGIAIAVLTIALITVLNIHVIFTIIGGAVVGLIIYVLFPNKAEKIIEKSMEKEGNNK